MSTQPANLHPFLKRLEAAWPVTQWGDVGVVVAVSGGADSVALLQGLCQLRDGKRGSLCVAHFNHQLRDSADEDEQFVAELVQKIAKADDLPLVTGKAATPIRDRAGGEGVEAAARAARYDFLLATANEVGARYVVTAHTADDQVETVLQRILRGTGLAGAGGIPRTRPLNPAVSLMRPLLGIPRSDVESFLRSLNQSYRDDPTNLDPSLTRNRIRHELLPHLTGAYNAKVRDAILRFSSLCGEAQVIIDEEVEKLVAEAVAFKVSSTEINCDRLALTKGYLVRELFIAVWKQNGWPQQAMSAEKWELLASLIGAAADLPAQVFPGSVRVFRRGQILFLQPAESKIIDL